jgi:hypothetical protein
VESDGRAPLFVGGTGRSGTTILARLIGSHSRYAFIPREIRFHAEPQALPRFVEGKSDTPEFVALMEHYWSYELDHPRGGSRGLSSLVSRQELDEALSRFVSRAAEDPRAAAATLVHDLLDPLARRAGKTAWVEMTPVNIMQGSVLASLFPDARFLHITRDGRDTVCSLVSRQWLPSIDEAIEWWGPRRTRTLLGADKIPAERLHTLTLEDLVRDEREPTYRGLLDFLGLEDEAGMRSFFDSEMDPGRAHIGRWREELDEETQMRLSERHDELERHAQLVLSRRRAGRPSPPREEQDVPFALLGADERTVGEVARRLELAGARLSPPARLFEPPEESDDSLGVAVVEPRLWIDPESVGSDVDAAFPGALLVLVVRDPTRVLEPRLTELAKAPSNGDRDPLADWIRTLLDEDGRPKAATGVRYASGCRTLGNLWDKRLLLMVYEHLVRAPQTELERVARHLGQELDPSAVAPEPSGPAGAEDGEGPSTGVRALLYECVCRAEVDALEDATGLVIRSWRPFLVT